MKIPFSNPRVLAAAGWIATAAIAFSVGRLTNPPGSTTVSSPAQDGFSNGAAGSATARNPSEKFNGTTVRSAQFALGEDGQPLTIAKLTNGQPIDKWIKNLMAQDDEIVRMTGLLGFLNTVTDTAELRAALEAMNLRGGGGFGRGSRFTEYGMLLQRWTQFDAKGALEFVGTRSREERFIGTSAVLRTWTKTDPTAAVAWAETSGKDLTLPEQWGGRGGSDGGQAQGNFAISFVISQLAHSDIDKALTIASTQTYDSRSRTVDTLASELVNQRGLPAAKAALDAMPAGTLRDGLTLQLTGRLASADASGTAKWALTLPEGETKSRALAEVVKEWVKTDPAAAGTFLTTLPATPEADRSRETYAHGVVEKDPKGAIAWASAITDEERRARTVESVARSWMKTDAAAAKEWVAQSPLSAEVKAKIQAPSQGGFGRGRGPGD